MLHFCIFFVLLCIWTYFIGREIAGPIPFFEPKPNAKRVKVKFLLIPIRDEEGNRYWLERVRIEQHYWDGYLGGGMGIREAAGWQTDKVYRLSEYNSKPRVVVGEMVEREVSPKTYRWSQEKIECTKQSQIEDKNNT